MERDSLREFIEQAEHTMAEARAFDTPANEVRVRAAAKAQGMDLRCSGDRTHRFVVIDQDGTELGPVTLFDIERLIRQVKP